MTDCEKEEERCARKKDGGGERENDNLHATGGGLDGGGNSRATRAKDKSIIQSCPRTLLVQTASLCS